MTGEGDPFLAAAIAEAEQSRREGGIPIGSVLVSYCIPRVIIGENTTFKGEEAMLASRGVTLEVRQDPTCIRLMVEFIRTHPELWNEDIGV